MAINYSADALTGRLQGLANHMASGSLVLYDGGTVLATISLVSPAASVSAGVLEFLGMPITTTAVATGNIDSASIFDSGNALLVENLTAGPPETAANIIVSNGLNSTAVESGQQVSALGGQISSVSVIGDALDYAAGGWDARFTGLVSIIDANSNGSIILRQGSTVLSTIQLAVPSGIASGGVLTFQGTLIDNSIAATGSVDNAIIVDGLGTEVITGLTVGIPGTSSDIILNNGFNTTLISVGTALQLTSATITGT